MTEPQQDTFFVSPDDLDFDLENPRFVDVEVADEAAAVQFLLDQEDLNELIQSISASGFINLEPLIAISSDGRYLVLEGNRRLAAVKILRSSELQSKLDIEIPPIAEDKQATLENLLVRKVNSRTEARAFIGFKHINGPHKWDSLAKAKYAADWLADNGEIQAIARTLGDSYNTVRRLIFGWFVLKQAEANGFSREDRTSRRFSFSHLYTAVSRPGFRAFLGLPEDPGDTPLKPNPVPPDHLGDLRQVMTWLYGSRSEGITALIQSQNPDLNKLADVLQHQGAKRQLLARGNLNEAYQVIEPRSRRFADALIEASQYARDALSLVPEYDHDPSLLDVGKSLKRTAERLVKFMEDELKGEE